MPSRKIPPVPRTRCKAPGAKAGCVSLRQVSLHKQRKVARAVTARKLLILIRLLPHKKRARAARCARPPHPALRATSLRAPALRSAQGVQACASPWLASSTPSPRKREKGWQSAFRGREKAVAAGRPAPHGSRKRLAAEATLTPPRIPQSRGLDSPPTPYHPPLTNGRIDQPARLLVAPPLPPGLVIFAVRFCHPVIMVCATVPALPLRCAGG